MITVEKSDPFSSESHRLIEMLSAELAAITGDNGKTNFTVEAMNDDKALWVLAKNTHGEVIGCGAIRQSLKKINKNKLTQFTAYTVKPKFLATSNGFRNMLRRRLNTRKNP